MFDKMQYSPEKFAKDAYDVWVRDMRNHPLHAARIYTSWDEMLPAEQSIWINVSLSVISNVREAFSSSLR